MKLLRWSCLLLGLSGWVTGAQEIVVGPPRVLADQGGYTSCVFVDPGVGGWQGLSLICSRVNQAQFAEELWRIPLAGGAPELIGYGRQPRVRGNMLVYVGTEPGREGIWLRDLSGQCAEQRLADDPALEWPTIAPDGQSVACFRPTERNSGIFLLPVSGGKGDWLVNRDERQPCYDLRTQRLLVTKNGQLWVLSGGAREQIVEERITDAGYEHVDASWGPGGEWVAFVGRWTDQAANVGLLHLPTRRTIWVTEGMSAARSPVISPNGKLLAYVAAAGQGNALYLRELRQPRRVYDPLDNYHW